MKLFDEISRTDLGPAGYAESDYSFLNRTARSEFAQVRDVLETWFTKYPLVEQVDLSARFRSNINHQHQAAFFELFLHELLLRLDCQITIHPTIAGTSKVPDFLANPRIASRFYVEATVATNKSTTQNAAEARENAAYDALNKLIESPNFFLALSLRGAPNTPPPIKRFAQELNRELARLDPDEVTRIYNELGVDGLPQWHFEHDGWKVKIRASPKKPEARGKPDVRPIGTLSTGFHMLDHRAAIKDSIVNKAAKYGSLDMPFVIAISASEPVDTTDIMEALFGKEQVSFLISENGKPLSEPQMTKRPDGAWFGLNGPQYTRVSAVLLVTQLSPWNLPRTNLCLYHNPWAQKKFDSVLTRLAQAIPENNQMKWINGDTADKIFKLPKTWPEKTVYD